MVSHQTVSPDFDILLRTPFFQQLKIEPALTWLKEDVMAAIAVLRNVVGKPGTTTIAILAMA